jgi:hypothetical protein
VLARGVRPVLPRVEGVLLVVRGELPRKERERGEGENAVCVCQRGWVRRGDQRGSGDQEQKDVLNRG